jgi:hypothetical protein
VQLYRLRSALFDLPLLFSLSDGDLFPLPEGLWWRARGLGSASLALPALGFVSVTGRPEKLDPKRDLTAVPSWSRNSPGCPWSSNRSWVFRRVPPSLALWRALWNVGPRRSLGAVGTHAPYKAVPRYILGWKPELLYAFIAQDRETNHWRSLEQRC